LLVLPSSALQQHKCTLPCLLQHILLWQKVNLVLLLLVVAQASPFNEGEDSGRLEAQSTRATKHKKETSKGQSHTVDLGFMVRLVCFHLMEIVSISNISTFLKKLK
jgi:hypothetical protein